MSVSRDVESIQHSELLAHVACLYYEDSLTQNEIAQRVHTSRSTVSRLLSEARERGMVEFVIHYPWKRSRQLEQHLVRRFSLEEARVLAGGKRSPTDLSRGLGMLAARFVEGVLAKDSVLGITGDKAAYSVVQALCPRRKLPITVVQMVGTATTDGSLINGSDLARSVADAYGGRYRRLHVPLIVENASVREALLRDPRVCDTLALARRADVALVGIGALVPGASSWLEAGLLTYDELSRLQAQGAVGEICCQHYDARGRVLDSEVNRRVVGIELEALRDIKRVIAVAGGRVNVEPILGALIGRYVDVLITDEAAAKGVLAGSGM